MTKGVLEEFPEGKPPALRNVLSLFPAEMDADRVLFLILLCGTRFGIYNPRLKEVKEELWLKFTESPLRMPPEFAEPTIDALAPETRVILDGGSRIGPWGPFVRQAGRPSSLGSWAATILVEYRLLRAGVAAPQAKRLAIDLFEALTGNGYVKTDKLRVAKKEREHPDPKPLSDEIDRQYYYWVKREGLKTPGINTKDLAPVFDDFLIVVEESDYGDIWRAYQAWADAYRVWNQKHKGLPFLLARFGSRSFSIMVLEKMPDELWKPLAGFGKRRPTFRESGFIQ